MRLVDADALLRDIEKYHVSDGKFQHWVQIQPTIEPERKKGKWIPHPGGKFVGFPYMHYKCDQCRDFEPEERNFCPNCGSQMERGGET